MTVDGVGIVREFVTNIPGDRIPEWQLYAFSPVFEFLVEDRPSLLEYAVYCATKRASIPAGSCRSSATCGNSCGTGSHSSTRCH